MNITTEQLITQIPKLKAGDKVELSGTIYTARDAAHKRLVEMINKGKTLPFDLENSIIYYCGPCPAKPGKAIGSCGPTTSSRMDAYTPLLLSKGVKATIGKGPRSKEVIKSLQTNHAVYLVATGGIGALLSTKVKKSEIIAFKDLGTEAIYRFEVVDFPVIVAVDSKGKEIFIR
ncbi:MAG: Fe-S-containing hydro-lyase [Endomicrobiales bacterium]|nr:Fe-S-containing hydro-lyase [Endomicrobiales bacterium]